jgi:hypothetical protein
MITINPITPMEDIHLLMQTGDLWDRFVQGDSDEFDENYICATTRDEWYGVEFDGELIGSLLCETVSSDTVMLHLYVSEPYRCIAKSIVPPIYRFLTWFRPEVEVLMLQVADCFKEVMMFARKAGFSKIYHVPDEYYKYGAYHGLNFYINEDWRVV